MLVTDKTLWYRDDPEAKKFRSNYMSEILAKKRLRVIRILGGKCVRCGFLDHRALQIDHINGDGCNERGNRGASYIVMAIIALFRQNKLDEIKRLYQLLCANCNWIKRYENGEWRGRK